MQSRGDTFKRLTNGSKLIFDKYGLLGEEFNRLGKRADRVTDLSQVRAK